MLAYKYGVHQYRCCPHNYGMGWPYYVAGLWLATRTTDWRLDVRRQQGDRRVGAAGEMVRSCRTTEYPFADEITFTVSTQRPVDFPLPKASWLVA